MAVMASPRGRPCKRLHLAGLVFALSFCISADAGDSASGAGKKTGSGDAAADGEGADVLCDLERVDASGFESPEEFRRAFRSRDARPAVLTGLSFGPGLLAKGSRGGKRGDHGKAAASSGGGDALAGWGQEALLRSFGDMTVESQHVVVYRAATASGKPLQTGLGAPTDVRSVIGHKDETLFLLKPGHASMDVAAKRLEVPPALGPLVLTGPTLSAGGNGSSSPFHQHQENWFWQIEGKKGWVMGPPDEDFGEAVQGVHPCHLLAQRRPSKKLRKRLKRCVMKPGEVIYLPSQWYHGTCNLGELSLGLGYIGGLDHLPPQHFAAAVGDEERLAQLVRRPADLVTPDGEGQRALHWAASRGHAGAVRRLLDLRSDPLVADQRGATPAHMAAFEGRLEPIRVLAEADPATATAPSHLGAQPLHLAASRGHAAVATALLEARAAADAKDNSGAEPLHMAAYEGHTAVARLLVARGAKPRALSKDGTRPEKLAETRQHHELAAWLSAGGRDAAAEL